MSKFNLFILFLVVIAFGFVLIFRDKSTSQSTPEGKNMIALNTLKLKNTEYKIVKAELTATIPDPYWIDTYNSSESKKIGWFLDIEAEPFDESEKALDGYGINISHEYLTFNIKSWKEIEGKVVNWDTPFNEYDEPNGNLYVFSHEDILNGNIEFSKRIGNKFITTWKGNGNIFWDDEFGKNVPFELNCEVTFKEVIVRCSEKDDNESVIQRIVQNLDPKEFEISTIELQPHKYQSGVQMAEVKLFPKVDEEL